MNQPTFSDGPPVPLMVEGLIDAPTLQQLFADLIASTTILSIQEKGTATAYSTSTPLSPEVARDRLLAGQSRASQVRYRHDGFEWTDTMIATGAGFRVIRCRHEV